jgi:hypothetical protein
MGRWARLIWLGPKIVLALPAAGRYHPARLRKDWMLFPEEDLGHGENTHVRSRDPIKGERDNTEPGKVIRLPGWRSLLPHIRLALPYTDEQHREI